MTGTAVLIIRFDDDCGLCSAAAAWARRHVPRAVFEPLGPQRRKARSVVVFASGRRHTGADAVAEVLAHADRHYLRLAGRLLTRAPFRRPARILYWVVARNRHRLSRLAGLDRCRV